MRRGGQARAAAATARGALRCACARTVRASPSRAVPPPSERCPRRRGSSRRRAGSLPRLGRRGVCAVRGGAVALVVQAARKVRSSGGGGFGGEKGSATRRSWAGRGESTPWPALEARRMPSSAIAHPTFGGTNLRTASGSCAAAALRAAVRPRWSGARQSESGSCGRTAAHPAEPAAPHARARPAVRPALRWRDALAVSWHEAAPAAPSRHIRALAVRPAYGEGEAWRWPCKRRSESWDAGDSGFRI